MNLFSDAPEGQGPGTSAPRGSEAGSFASPAVWALAAVTLAAHLATSRNYGVFRDEFYYLACADHLDWGYVDHPPLSIALLWIQRALLGDSQLALRVLPAVAGALLVLLAGRMARELGGGRLAQVLAALTVAAAPQYRGIASFFSMNVFDLVFWALAALVVIRIVKTGDARWWLLLGGIAGLSLMNKISLLFFLFGLAVAVVLTPLRSQLKTPYPWLGALIAGVLVAPHVLWQVQHGWPTLEFMSNATRLKIADLTPLQFLTAQVIEIHPFNAPVWLAGLGYLLFGREGRRFRVLGIVFLVVLATLLLQKSKPYYLGPAYPMLLAAGAVAVEPVVSGRRWAATAVLATLGAGGLLTAPLAMPVLPVDALIAYARGLGIAPVNAEKHATGALPQHFADRFGWEEMTEAVARAYLSLPPEDRAEAMIVTSNYGEAGALDYLGRRRGLPRAVSQHNNYYLWGPGPGTGRVVITVGMSPGDLRNTFESVEPVGRVESPYAMPFETSQPVSLCRGLKLPLEEAWRRGKKFI